MGQQQKAFQCSERTWTEIVFHKTLSETFPFLGHKWTKEKVHSLWASLPQMERHLSVKKTPSLPDGSSQIKILLYSEKELGMSECDFPTPCLCNLHDSRVFLQTRTSPLIGNTSPPSPVWEEGEPNNSQATPRQQKEVSWFGKELNSLNFQKGEKHTNSCN